MVLIGPNGAGKTTTMRSLCGIIKPTAGQLTVAGYDVLREPLHVKRRIAYVPDDPPLFESMTIWEHFQFIASAYRVADFVPLAELLLAQFELVSKQHVAGERVVARHAGRKLQLRVRIFIPPRCCYWTSHDWAPISDHLIDRLNQHGRAKRCFNDHTLEILRAFTAMQTGMRVRSRWLSMG